MPLPFAIVLQCHTGKIRKLDVAIVRQKPTEMELNGVQYPRCGAAEGERSDFIFWGGSAHRFSHENERKPQDV